MFTISFPKIFVCQPINAAAQQRYKLYNTKNKYNEKKRPEATQTLRAGVVRRTHKQTHTHTQTGAITIHCAA